MSTFPLCPYCQSQYVYQDQLLFICPDCTHEWTLNEVETPTETDLIVKDANGTTLQNGDTISVIKDLKVKGSSAVVKAGTKVKNIRLVEGDHNIDCKIIGVGDMALKSEFVKKI